jgi:hypothetical protein
MIFEAQDNPERCEAFRDRSMYPRHLQAGEALSRGIARGALHPNFDDEVFSTGSAERSLSSACSSAADH